MLRGRICVVLVLRGKMFVFLGHDLNDVDVSGLDLCVLGQDGCFCGRI